MAKYLTMLVAVLASVFMYRTADVYFTERRLRHAVWDAMDPSVRDDSATRQLILERIKALKVDVNPNEIQLSVEEKADSGGAIGGVIQVSMRILTVTFPFEYRKMGAVKKGVLTIKRQSASKGVVSAP